MAFCRWLRELLVQFIGVFAAVLALIGIDTCNNQFNGQMINQYGRSKLLKNGMVIRRFYLYETLIHHNFVVFQTDLGQTFKVHLIADVDPAVYPPIHVEIGPTYWKPTREHVEECNKDVRDLKRFVKHEIRNFGIYEVGFNDCRHFARAVAAFLAN
jgi:hypothetical protein